MHLQFQMADLRFLHSEKACFPNTFIISPILIPVIEVDSKAFAPIAVTGMPFIVSGITIDVSDTPSFKPVIIISPLYSEYLKILSVVFPPFFDYATKKETKALNAL